MRFEDDDKFRLINLFSGDSLLFDISGTFCNGQELTICAVEQFEDDLK